MTDLFIKKTTIKINPLKLTSGFSDLNNIKNMFHQDCSFEVTANGEGELVQAAVKIKNFNTSGTNSPT